MVNINIQGSSTKFPLTVDPNETIEDIKGKIIEQITKGDDKPTIDQLRLIFSGQILKNDKSVSFYNIKEGHTVHLVKSQPQQAAPQSTPYKPQPAQSEQLPPLSQFTGGMNANLLFQQVFSGGGENRERGGMPAGMGMGGGRNGGFGNMRADELKRQIQVMREHPELFRELLSSVPLVPGMNGSTEANEQFIRMMMEPGRMEQVIDMMTDPGTGEAVLPDQYRPQFIQSQGRPGSEQQQQVRQNEPSTVDVRPPEEKWANELKALNEMGFWDAKENIVALQSCGGNINAAIEKLLGNIN